jgi:protein-S-isoprenylcysteine O-methyltransferase Ste14
MGKDDTFRMLLLLGLIFLLPIAAAYYRVISQPTGEKLDRRQEGLFILLTLRPLGFAMMAGLIAFIIDPTWMAWSSVPVPIWMRWMGVGLSVIAGVLLTWTLGTLGKNLTDTVATRREHTLVTTGPYRHIRHPFYSAVALAVVANSIIAGNWFLLLTGSLVFTLLAFRCAREEENLVSTFGDRYRRYMHHTGRFFPRF